MLFVSVDLFIIQCLVLNNFTFMETKTVLLPALRIVLRLASSITWLTSEKKKDFSVSYKASDLVRTVLGKGFMATGKKVNFFSARARYLLQKGS